MDIGFGKIELQIGQGVLEVEYNLISGLRKHDPLAVFTVNALGNRANELVDSEGFDASKAEIKLVVNGIEFDAKEAIELWANITQDEINRRAKELVGEITNGLVSELYNLEQRIKSKIPW